MTGDDIFRPGFAEDLAAQWNRGPRVFRNALQSPMFTEEDFMASLRGAARDYIADPNGRIPPGRVYIDTEVATAQQLAALLPTNVESCDDYVRRARRLHPRQDIGIVLDNCEKHVPSMRDFLIPILHHLFGRVGYPARRNHLCVYAGTYMSTPFGIHRDDCHVFMFCGTQKKTMAFWPRPYFDSRQDLFVNGKLRARTEDHLDAATILELGPLDVLYWSADDWHVAYGESNDFHAALSVGIYHHGSSAETLGSFDFLSAATHVEGLDIPGLPGAHEGHLSADALRAGQMSGLFGRWDEVREVMNRPEEIEFRALGLAVRLVSSAGYGRERTPPAAAPADLSGLTLECPVPDALVVARVREGLMVGANGAGFFFQNHIDAIERLVHDLRRSRTHRVNELFLRETGDVWESLASAIGDFVAAGALHVVTSGDAQS